MSPAPTGASVACTDTQRTPKPDFTKDHKMATTNYGVNHPLAVKLWGKKTYHEALSSTYFGKFMGSDSNSLIQVHEDLQKSQGDRIRIPLRMLLSGAGVQGDAALEGQEESLTTYYDDIFIDQLRHAVRSAGKMSEQRVPFEVREEARMGLQDWWADRLDVSMFNQLGGYTDQADTRYTGNQVTIAPDSTHLFAAGGHDTEASLSATTTHSLKLSDLDRAVAKAKTLQPLMRPVKVGGDDFYVAFFHPNQVYQFRRDASTAGNWIDIQKAAMTGGQVKDNPIFTGALGVYNGVVLHESTRVPLITGTPASGAKADYRRAIFCGAQAGILAVGQGNNAERVNWTEEVFDYGNQLGVSGGMIFGVKKTVFNSKDFSTLVISSYAPAP